MLKWFLRWNNKIQKEKQLQKYNNDKFSHFNFNNKMSKILLIDSEIERINKKLWEKQ
jgi:hypothetical protein